MADETHTLVVDRFEGDLAVVELDGGRTLELPRWLLPAGARPDDVLRLHLSREGGAVLLRVEPDPDATRRARERAGRLVDDLRSTDPGGDLVL